MENKQLRDKYDQTCNHFIERLKKDKYIEAVFIYGSYANGNLSDDSDIDAVIVGKDDKYPGFNAFCLVEDDICVNTLVFNRSSFKMYSDTPSNREWKFMFNKSLLIYSTDDIYKEYWEKAQTLWKNDREILLMRTTGSVLSGIVKRKHLKQKTSLERSFLSVYNITVEFCKLIVLLGNEIPYEIPIEQAIKINSYAVEKTYTRMIKEPANWDTYIQVVDYIERFIEEHVDLLFKFLFDYFKENTGEVSSSKIKKDMQNIMPVGEFFMHSSLEWLTEKGILSKYSTPITIAKGSRILLDEGAYIYHRA